MSELLDRLGRRLRREGSRIDADEVDRRLAGLRSAVAAAEGRLPQDALDRARQVIAVADQRRQLFGDLTVVALAGSTGAGKSSTFNRLVGREAAATGVRRPTTSEPTAAVWGDPAEAAPLLEWLDVTQVHAVPPPADGGEDPLAGLVLVDLPDHDSVVTGHREQVDRLIDRVDVTAWLVDPQKYADALVHDAYLHEYAHHADVTVVLLNQADRLPAGDLAAVEQDLRRLLALDGLPDVRVISTSAVTGQGYDELRDLLARTVRERRAALVRLGADTSAAAADLAEAAGPGTPTAGVPSPAQAEEVLVDSLARAAGVDTVATAVGTSVRRRASQRTGWPVTRWLTLLRPDPVKRLRLDRAATTGVDPSLVRTSLPSADPVAVARASAAVRDYADATSAGAPAAWVRSARSAAQPRGAAATTELMDALDTAVARARVTPAKDPWWWGLVGALQWLLFGLAVAGGLWLLALAFARFLAFDLPGAPTVEGIPVPTLMLVTGLLGGVVLAALSRLLVGGTARRAERRARAAVEEQVRVVAREQVVEPVQQDLATLRTFQEGLAAARGAA